MQSYGWKRWPNGCEKMEEKDERERVTWLESGISPEYGEGRREDKRIGMCGGEMGRTTGGHNDI